MSIEYIFSISQFNERFITFEKECKVKEDPSLYHVGLDCEYISKSSYPESFKLSENWTIKRTFDISICIIQIASKNSCLIIDIQKIGAELPSKLKMILESGNWIKTGVGINLDMRYIVDNFNLQQCSGHIDLSTMAIFSGCQISNLADLYQSFDFGILDKSKGQMRDWTQPLTTETLLYAGNDAFASYKIGERILKTMSNGFLTDFKIEKIKSHIKIGISDTEKSYVNILQEYAQKKGLPFPTYVIGENVE